MTQGSDLDGVGVFATQDLKLGDEAMPLYVVGSYEVLTPQEVLHSVEIDGVPRYALCTATQFKALLEPTEIARDGATLCLKPDPMCFLYYINSSFNEAGTQNVARRSLWDGKWSKQDVKSMLSDSEHGVEFKISRELKQGEELLHDYFIPDYETGGDPATKRPAVASIRSSARLAGGPVI